MSLIQRSAVKRAKDFREKVAAKTRKAFLVSKTGKAVFEGTKSSG